MDFNTMIALLLVNMFILFYGFYISRETIMKYIGRSAGCIGIIVFFYWVFRL